MSRREEQTGMPWAPPPRDPVESLPEDPIHRHTAQERRIAKGNHPLFDTPIPKRDGFSPIGKCSDCVHAVRRGGGGRFGKGWWKCDVREDSTAKTDIRPSWPACDGFLRRDDA